MYFIVHLQNNKSTKVSPQTFFFLFFFLLEGVYYANLYLTTAANSPSMRAERKRAEGSWRAYNHTLQPAFPPHAWGGGNNKKKTGKHSCGVHDLHWFWLVLTPLPPPTNKHTLCFIMVCCWFLFCFLPSQQQSATAVSASPLPLQKVYIFDKKVGTFKKTWAFFVVNNNRLILHVGLDFLKSS